MHRSATVFLCLVFVFAGAVAAHADDTTGDSALTTITKGQLSALILEAATGANEGAFDSRTSLRTAQRLGLVPTDWNEGDVVASRELRSVLTQLGAENPAAADNVEPVSVTAAREQISANAELVRTAITSRSALVDLEPAVRTEKTDSVEALGDQRAVRDLSASDF